MWQPIETVGELKYQGDLWVCGLAEIFTGSCPFAWQGQAGFDAESGEWVGGYNDRGEMFIIKPTHFMKLPELPKEIFELSAAQSWAAGPSKIQEA